MSVYARGTDSRRTFGHFSEVPKAAVSGRKKIRYRRAGYSITSAACARSSCGTVRASALAVFRLMTSSDDGSEELCRAPRITLDGRPETNHSRTVATFL